MPAANTLRLDDGYSTIITLANIPTVKLYEKEVTPPQVSAGGAIDTTTMRNPAWRSMAPRALKTMGAMTATVAYATEAIPTIWNQIGVIQLVTVTFPDASEVVFWGWVEEFTPAAHVDGTQPTATITIQPSMRDADGNEAGPGYNAPDNT